MIDGDSDTDADKSFDFRSVKCGWINSSQNAMILDRQESLSGHTHWLSDSSSHKHNNCQNWRSILNYNDKGYKYN